MKETPSKRSHASIFFDNGFAVTFTPSLMSVPWQIANAAMASLLPGYDAGIGCSVGLGDRVYTEEGGFYVTRRTVHLAVPTVISRTHVDYTRPVFEAVGTWEERQEKRAA